jgi:Bacterial Ig-like domain (group 3)/FG-GAP-like repeat/FG-GAP repeat
MSRNSRLLSALLAISGIMPIAAQVAPLPTVTTLNISAQQVAWHATPITLTAQVTAGGASVSAGTVTFCDTSGLYARCEDSAIVGKAQLNGGSAKISFYPSLGAHQYTAFFNATTAAAKSLPSAPQNLTVTGLYPTTTTLAPPSGNPGGYDLTATVVGFANHPPFAPPLLSGTVSFEDTSNNNFVLGTASLGPPSFGEMFVEAPGAPIVTGNQPAAGATADFNGDGIPDLAIMASVSNAVYIMLGKGDGTFNPGQVIPNIGTIRCILDPPLESLPSNCSMTTGDFDNDGKADLAVTSGSDNAVYILLGNGDGTFNPAPGSPVIVGNFPEAVRTGDFDNDGILDLAVANTNDSTVTFLRGKGDGTFAPFPGSPVPTGLSPFYITVADFNGDGLADLATSNADDNTVTVLLNTGGGAFIQAPGSPIPNINYSPEQIVSADFNSDGIPDLAIANFYPSPFGNVVVLLGKGDGSFNPAPGSPVTVGVYPLALVAADFNQDGHTDLGVDNYGMISNPPTQTLTLLLGDGNGNFTPYGTPTTLAYSPNDLVPADYNGDGFIDLAIPEIANFRTDILLNELTQTATASVSNITVAGTGTHYADAVYGGNTYFATSTSNLEPLQGSQINTSLTLTANQYEQMLTMPVTFTATLASLANEPPYTSPTGTVSFFDVSLGNKLLGTAAMGANFQAIFTLDTSSIGPGVHVISASYSGDRTFLPSNSNQISEQVDDLGISRVGNNNTNILPGTTVIYTLQLTPYVATKFLYTVNFSTSGLPAGAAATFSPVTLAAGGSAAKVTMTVTTAASASNAPPSPFGRLPLALGLLLPLFGNKAVRRRLRNIPPLLGAVLLAVLSLTAVAGLSGCSGAGLFAAKKVSYPITVTATEGTRQVSTTVPLAIQ